MKNRLIIGRVLGIVSGLFPLSVGSYWLSKTLFAKHLQFWSVIFESNHVVHYSPSLNDLFYVVSHVGYANLIATGTTAIFLNLFGIPKRLKWAWCLFLFLVLWAGVNDSIATLWYFSKGGNFLPIPLIPTTLGFISLFLTRPYVFKPES